MICGYTLAEQPMAKLPEIDRNRDQYRSLVAKYCNFFTQQQLSR
ncbi:MAG: hypothetical protein OFPI_44540 [Osedax symbiont Rs2]|nr:MAG: hypothetical protein OFPI_44540 [Osedax symbiont Rs2]